MMTKKEAVLLLEQDEPQAEPRQKNSIPSVAQSPSPVKQRFDDLQSLRTSKGIPVKDMVDVVQTLYPKYDKIIQSKCEHGKEYGIQIRDDAWQALLAKFAPESVKRKARDRKRNANRIQARLSETVGPIFRKALSEDGYTVQSWVEAQVYAYLEGRREKSV